MDSSEWPQVVDMVEGWFNQPIPAKTATMWYAELHHYDAERVVAAFGAVVQRHESPYLPPLGLVLKTLRDDGRGTPNELVARRHARFMRTDQFQLTKGSATSDEDDDDRDLARGLICGTAGCGYTPVLAVTTACPLCGGALVSDGYMLAAGARSATAGLV